MHFDPHSNDKTDTPPQEGPQLDSNQLIAVCKSLYRECADDLEVDAANLNHISMEQFVGWCVAHNQPMEQAEEFTSKLGLRKDCCKTIDELFRGSPWQCASILSPVWFIVVLQHRPPVENAVAFVHVSLTIGFRDQKVMQMAGAKEMEPGLVNTDGFLLSFMDSQANSMMQQMAHIGIDRLHDNYAQQVSEGPQDVQRKEIPQPPPSKIGWS